MAPDTTHTARGNRTLVALFALYLVLLVWIVVWKLAVPWIGEAALLPHPIKLIPFLPDGEADASSPLEVGANILLFIPFGIYLGLLAPLWKWWQAAIVFVGASVVLETTQLVLSTGSFDVTDVITNTAGGLAGLGLLALARRRLRDRTVPIVTRICAIGAGVLLVAIAVFLVSPIRYVPQHDVIVHSSARR